MLNQVEETLQLSNYNDNKLVSQVSKATGVKPEHVTFSALTTFLLLSIFTGYGQRAILLTLSFLYPAYKSFKALETAEDHDDKRWLTYWVVFGFVFAFNDVTNYILSYLPFGNFLLSLAMLFVYCPLTNGYVHLYNMVFRPVLKTYEHKIDKYL